MRSLSSAPKSRHITRKICARMRALPASLRMSRSWSVIIARTCALAAKKRCAKRTDTSPGAGLWGLRILVQSFPKAPGSLRKDGSFILGFEHARRCDHLLSESAGRDKHYLRISSKSDRRASARERSRGQPRLARLGEI